MKFNADFLRMKIPVQKDVNILNLLIHVARFPIREAALIYIPLVALQCLFSEYYKMFANLIGENEMSLVILHFLFLVNFNILNMYIAHIFLF